MLGFGQAIMGGAPTMVGSVFAATAYTGNGATQTITSNIDLTGAAASPLLQGGLVWIKTRGVTGFPSLFDTVRGATNYVRSSGTAIQSTSATSLTAFAASGFTLGSDANFNTNAAFHVAWTFRRAAKFFDVISYTGDGTSNRAINHGLTTSPGMVVTRILSNTGDCNLYHRSATGDLALNTTAAQAASQAIVTAVSSTTFTVTGVANTNAATYVAYLFGHDTAVDGVIQCGTYTGNGSATGPTVTLGWQPQCILLKGASGTGNWYLADTTRGFTSGSETYLLLNSTAAESTAQLADPLPTGFQIMNSNAEVNGSAATYVYMAIRAP